MIYSKNTKGNYSQKAKRWIWWGVRERMADSGQFIASVGDPSGWSFQDVRTRVPRDRA
jgi:hypothetical protein